MGADNSRGSKGEVDVSSDLLRFIVGSSIVLFWVLLAIQAFQWIANGPG
jgi:hypothetical protein